MSFLPNQSQSLWLPWVTTLVVSVCVSVARAEPPSRESRSKVPVVQADDEPWQATADEVGEYIEQLERHLGWMHRRAERRKDSDTVAEVEAIQKKLSVARDHHRKLCRLCAAEIHDTQMARECCQQIDDILYEVIDEHVALMRRLRVRPTRAP